MNALSRPQHDVQQASLLQIVQRSGTQRDFQRALQAAVYRTFQSGRWMAAVAISGLFCIYVLEEFVTTHHKMIAAKTFITNGSNPRLLASSVTARFVKMHRTKFPRVPGGHRFFVCSCWYGHNFFPSN